MTTSETRTGTPAYLGSDGVGHDETAADYYWLPAVRLVERRCWGHVERYEPDSALSLLGTALGHARLILEGDEALDAANGHAGTYCAVAPAQRERVRAREGLIADIRRLAELG